MKRLYILFFAASVISTICNAQTAPQANQVNLKPSLRVDENKGRMIDSNGKATRSVFYGLKDENLTYSVTASAREATLSHHAVREKSSVRIDSSHYKTTIDGLSPETKNSDNKQASLSQALNKDGSLKTGVDGSFDPTGYSMSYGNNGEPIFSNSIAAAGDERWATIQNFSGLNGSVNAVYTNGVDVYIGGNFTNAGGNPNADYIAVYSGGCWGSLATGLNGPVNTIAERGVNIYVGGNFTNAAGNPNIDYIAVWDGEFWNALGTGLNQVVNAIEVVGADVYVGGFFNNAGSVSTADGLAIWNGSNWTAVGASGTPNVGVVNALEVDENNVLYVGGTFTNLGGNPNADYIAKWNGSSWSSLGAGLNLNVHAIAVTGTDVYVGGLFDNAGGLANADYVARWNGSSWNALGSTPLQALVTEIAVYGSHVFIGGGFLDIGGNSNARYVAVWDGSSFSSLGTGLDGSVGAITKSNYGVYIGGGFTNAGGFASADGIAEWTIGAPHFGWGPFSSGIPNVNAVAVKGPDIYVGGDFFGIGGNRNIHGIAKWNGESWNSMGEGVAGIVNAIEVVDSKVYVGGIFGSVGGNTDINSIAVWDGTTWSGLGLGIGNDAVIYDIEVNGTNVLVCGEFDFPQRIARWNGSTWNALGAGLNGTARAMTFIGSDLYVGGDFTNAGGNANADYIAKWNGSVWSSLNTGLTNNVWSLAADGTDLYVGGEFQDAGGVASADYIAKWDGSAWQALGIGLEISSGSVRSIEVSGSNLYVGGRWTSTDPNRNNIAVWNGNNWNNLGSGVINPTALAHVTSIVALDTKVYIGGEFTESGDGSFSALNIAQRTAVFPDAFLDTPEPKTPTQVTLKGLVNSHGLAGATYRFEWGSTITNITNFSSAQSYSSTVATPVSLDISPGVSSIFYRIKTENTEGVSYSKISSYTFPPDIEINQGTSILASGSEYNFGNINQSSSSTAISFLLNNLGLGSLNLSGTAGSLLVKGGAHASEFTIVQTGVTSPVAYNTSRPFTVQFTPLAGGVRTATLTVTSNDPDEASYMINLKGNGMLAQTITFGALPVKQMGDANFALSASASSGLAVAFVSSDLSVATVSGTTVTLIGPGATTITASQAGNDIYNPAVIVLQTLTVRNAEPTVQANSLSFTIPSVDGLGVGWVNGNGTERMVVARQTSAVNVDPTDGTSYTGNANFSTAPDLGSGNKVIYRGSGNSALVTNLTTNTIYHFRVYELNGSAALTNYNSNTAASNPNSRTTLQAEPTTQPTALSFSNVTINSLDASFTAASGSPLGYLVLRKEGAAATASPLDGSVYSLGTVVGDGTVVYVGAPTTFTDTSLDAGKIYYYTIFSFNGSGLAINYLTTGPTTNSTITISSAPLAGAATSVLQTSFQANWGSVTGTANYVLDVSLDNFSNLLSGYSGKAVAGLSEAVTGLTPGVTYQYRVRASNASGLSSNSATINQLTLPATPTAAAATALTPTSFVANWTSVVSATGYFLDVATNATFTTFQVGYNNLSVTGASQSVTGLSSGVTFYYRVRSVNTTGVSPSSLAIETATITTEPLAQPTAISFSNPSSAGFSVSYAGALGSPAGYIALMKEGSAPTEVPQDGSTYTLGSTIGMSKIVHIGSAPTFSASSLNANSIYYISIFSFNGSSLATNYLTSNPLIGSRTTLQTPPMAQPTALAFSNVTFSSLDVEYTAAVGVDGYVVIRRADSAPTSTPVPGTTYSAGNTLGDGTVVFVGASTSFNQTGLTQNTNYFYSVFSYRGTSAATNYLSTSPLSGSRVTLVSEPTSAPTALTFPTFTVNSLGGSFTASAADGYMVLQRQGASPTAAPIDGTTYSVGNKIGDGTVVALGAATTFSATSLTSNTVYQYDVIAYNGSGSLINYNTTSRLEGSRTTLQTEPTAQPTAITFGNITISSLESSFTAASGSPGGYVVLRKQGSAPTFTPVDGTPYPTGIQGDALVVSSSAGNTFTDASLVAGTTYHYAVYSFNGASQAINYLTSLPLSTSVITITASPTATSASVVAQTSFTANWSSSTGANNYSLDVSEDNFSNLLGGYAAKSVGGLSDIVTGLNPGTTYQYRVRANNASGLSANSNTINQITIPQTPANSAAQQVRSNDFKAVWSASAGATGYQLDVSQNDFVSFIAGYQSKSISASLTEETVTGLSPNTQYQYRVRSVNAGGPSPNSNSIAVTTLSVGGSSPLAIGTVQSPSTIASGIVINVSANVTGGSGSTQVEIRYRKVTETAFTILATTGTNNLFQANIPAFTSEDTGIEFYARATAGSETVESPKYFVYRAVPADQATPISTITKFGGSLESYQIISIPFQLEDNLISSIFEPALGSYDKTKWRLVRFQNGRNTDYQAGLTRINQGESYWFNSIESITVKPGAASTPQFNQSKPFVLKLTQGWNQISTPFPFAIDWDDILLANGNPAGIGKYKVYVPTTVNFAESNSMLPYSGGFVFADQAKDLNLSVTLKNTAGGKVTNQQSIGSEIAGVEWVLPFTLKQGAAMNPLGAIGMRTLAKQGKDDFDDITLPRFVKYLEFNSYHEDFIAPRFSKDIVPTAEKHVWKIMVESNFDAGEITLEWDNSKFGTNEAQLLLYDPAAGLVLDMRTVTSYSLPNASKKELQIFYYQNKNAAIDGSILLDRPFPNPSSGAVTFKIFNPATTQAQLEIFDLVGRKIFSSIFSLEELGVSDIQWPGLNTAGDQVSAGIYVYRLSTDSSESSKTIQGRILIK